MKKRERNPISGIKGGIISLKQGLGKTLISIVHTLISPKCTSTLIITSKTVMQTWKHDGFEKFFGNRVKVLYLHCGEAESHTNLTPAKVRNYDFVVTTYEMCVSAFKKGNYADEVEYKVKDKIQEIRKRNSIKPNPRAMSFDILYNVVWDRVFCDESQVFVNPKTQTYKSMMGLCSKFFWCLSGTPIKNTSVDLWSQLRVCGYSTITKPRAWDLKGPTAMKIEKLDECIIKMNYVQAGISLPSLKWHVQRFSQAEKESICYNFALSNVKVAYDSMLQGKVNFTQVLVLFTRLRQICIAPWLMTQEAKRGSKQELCKRTNDSNADADLGIKQELARYIHNKKDSGINSTKMQAAVKIIRKVVKANEKVIVFSKFTSALDLLRDAVKTADKTILTAQVDGDVTGKERNKTITQFRTSSSHNVLLITYGTGSEGINLIEANHVILIEPHWHSVVHEQAISRAHRQGQTRPVHVYKLFIKDSIEDRIVKVCQEKTKVSKDMLSGAFGKYKKLDQKQLGYIIGN